MIPYEGASRSWLAGTTNATVSADGWAASNGSVSVTGSLRRPGTTSSSHRAKRCARLVRGNRLGREPIRRRRQGYVAYSSLQTDLERRPAPSFASVSLRACASRRTLLLALDGARELRPRGDPELLEHVAEVALDRLRADDEAGCDLLVRQPLHDERCDAFLLRRERRARHSPRDPRAAARSSSRARVPRPRPDRAEGRPRSRELLSRILAPLRPAERLAVEEPSSPSSKRLPHARCCSSADSKSAGSPAVSARIRNAIAT